MIWSGTRGKCVAFYSCTIIWAADRFGTS